jgi:hypothetical protein
MINNVHKSTQRTLKERKSCQTGTFWTPKLSNSRQLLRTCVSTVSGSKVPLTRVYTP